jgi:hypothetical protein
MALLVTAAVTAFVTGTAAAIATWHVRRRGLMLAAWMAWPFVVGAIAWFFVLFVEQHRGGPSAWAVYRFATAAAFEAVVLAIGFRLGLPMARGLARVFIPARPRQALAFLWHADGKTPPAASPPKA